MKAATGEFNSMPNKERKLVQLPSGYHFVGHAAHVHDGKLSRRVRVEYENQTRQDVYRDLFFILDVESSSPKCLCFCGKTLNLQHNSKGTTFSYGKF